MSQVQGPIPPAQPVAPIAAARGTPSPSAIYEGFRAQRRELSNQLDDLEGTRRGITSQLEELDPANTDRKPLENRLTDIDTRISQLRATLNSSSLFDDGRSETLAGGSSFDWFLTGAKDKIKDRTANDRVN